MYENERLCESRGMEKVCTPAPNGSMTDLLRENSCIANDVLLMTRRINGHLFGEGNTICEQKEVEAICFHDELQKQKSTLLMVAETLSVICSRLGI